jgi:two-component system, OmpR family, sensor histidine kinase MtrB
VTEPEVLAVDAPLRRGIHPGLRARIAISVALVTLLLSIVLAVTTLTVTRRTLIDQREDSVSRRVLANAQTIDGALGGSGAEDLQTVLSSLSDAGKPSLILANGAGRPVTVSLDARYGVDALPRALKDRVVTGGESGIMRFRVDGQPVVAVGVPLPAENSAYFEIYKLDDIDAGLRTLGLTLIGATVITTVAAGAIGYWASRYTLTPLTRIGEAAEAVALGQLDTRIDYDAYAHDADLAPLVANFNGMVSGLQERIDRDARFASDVSHELRSPLTTLNAGIQVLANNRDDMPDRARQALDLLEKDVERFTQLVEDLLEISRFDAGAVRLELDDVALVPLVRTTVNNLTHGAVPVDSDPDLDELVLACDKRRLVRILANYLNNADKYADGATGVYVERHDPEPDVPFDEATVRIGVEDAGPGVPESERQRIFDRFNRGDQGGSRGSDFGVGLGLALAAEHARLQGGRVWVEDRHDGGQGARFVLELPLLEPFDDGTSAGTDLSEATPEAASALTLTGEHKAVVIDADRGTGTPS